MVSIAVVDRSKVDTKKEVFHVNSGYLLRLYKVESEEKTLETKIKMLETRLDNFIQSTLRSLLTSEDIEVMTMLSEASLQNITGIERLVKQIQGTSNEE